MHGDMHGREAKHRTNMNGCEKTLPELEEGNASRAVSAGNATEGMVQEGRDRGLWIAARLAGSLFIQSNIYAVYIIILAGSRSEEHTSELQSP